MSYVGNKPSGIPLTAADLYDGIIDGAKLADGSVVLTSTDVVGVLPVAKGGTGVSVYTPTVDTNPIVMGSVDGTKQVRLEVDGLTTATTRVVTVPDANFTMVGDTTAQTLTNKTLTGYTETVYTLAGTTNALTEANGSIQTWALSGASTLTDGLTTGQSVILQITPGAFSMTWPTMTWTKVGGSGTAPTLYAAGKTSVLLWKIGTTLFGSHIGDS